MLLYFLGDSWASSESRLELAKEVKSSGLSEQLEVNGSYHAGQMACVLASKGLSSKETEQLQRASVVWIWLPTIWSWPPGWPS